MNELLNEAKNMLRLADGREGPVDEQHATQLVIARALIVIADSLVNIAESADIARAAAMRDFMTDLYSNEE